MRAKGLRRGGTGPCRRALPPRGRWNCSFGVLCVYVFFFPFWPSGPTAAARALLSHSASPGGAEMFHNCTFCSFSSCARSWAPHRHSYPSCHNLFLAHTFCVFTLHSSPPTTPSHPHTNITTTTTTTTLVHLCNYYTYMAHTSVRSFQLPHHLFGQLASFRLLGEALSISVHIDLYISARACTRGCRLHTHPPGRYWHNKTKTRKGIPWCQEKFNLKIMNTV